MEQICFWTGLCFLLIGLVIFVLETIGIFKFNYVMNRLHAAAMGDTLGLGASIIGLLLISGLQSASWKLILILLLYWCTSPVASHMLAMLEMTTNEDKEKHLENYDSVQSVEEELAERTDE